MTETSPALPSPLRIVPRAGWVIVTESASRSASSM